MIVIILTCGRMFLKSKEIGAKKMLVDDKIKSTACVKEIMSSGCCMQSLEKCLEFLNILLSLITFAINFVFRVNYWFFFTSCQQPTFFECIVILL